MRRPTENELARRNAVKNAKIVMDRQADLAAKKVGFESFLKNNKAALAQDFWYKNTGSWLPADHISIQSILKDDKRMRKLANDFADHETNTHGGWNWIAKGADTLFNNTYTKDGASGGEQNERFKAYNKSNNAGNHTYNRPLEGPLDRHGNYESGAKENYLDLLKASGEIPAWGTGSRDLKEKLDVLAYGAGSTLLPGTAAIKVFQGMSKTVPIVKKVADWVANNKKKVIGTAIGGSPLIYDGPFNIMDQAHDVKFGIQDDDQEYTTRRDRYHTKRPKQEVSFGKLIDDTKDTYKSIGELAQMPFEENPKEFTMVDDNKKEYTFPSRYQAVEHAKGLLSYLEDEKQAGKDKHILDAYKTAIANKMTTQDYDSWKRDYQTGQENK